ncbi:hypothetical protein HAX54_044272 [Datura stramonium]|uniref:Uncharacterized protein n=1 Tax=Datura stramonium TaxID=4076 RepID=A0ABS8W3N6_DATST|nr:hypothetical protein [Datura stramonium]
MSRCLKPDAEEKYKSKGNNDWTNEHSDGPLKLLMDREGPRHACQRAGAGQHRAYQRVGEARPRAWPCAVAAAAPRLAWPCASVLLPRAAEKARVAPTDAQEQACVAPAKAQEKLAPRAWPCAIAVAAPCLALRQCAAASRDYVSS